MAKARTGGYSRRNLAGAALTTCVRQHSVDGYGHRRCGEGRASGTGGNGRGDICETNFDFGNSNNTGERDYENDDVVEA